MKTALQNALDEYENIIGGKFKPDHRFYTRVEINPKRFAQLLRGEKAVFGYEAKNLAAFFDVPLDDLYIKENLAPTENRTVSSQSA